MAADSPATDLKDLSLLCDQAGVVERCAAAHGRAGCVKIYGGDMETMVRIETCRAWCPLLRQAIAAALLLLALAGQACAEERRYTAAEIDDLRAAVEQKWLFGCRLPGSSGVSKAYRENEKTAAVEQQVRTYMQAGLVAADICTDKP